MNNWTNQQIDLTLKCCFSRSEMPKQIITVILLNVYHRVFSTNIRMLENITAYIASSSTLSHFFFFVIAAVFIIDHLHKLSIFLSSIHNSGWEQILSISFQFEPKPKITLNGRVSLYGSHSLESDLHTEQMFFLVIQESRVQDPALILLASVNSHLVTYLDMHLLHNESSSFSSPSFSSPLAIGELVTLAEPKVSSPFFVNW